MAPKYHPTKSAKTQQQSEQTHRRHLLLIPGVNPPLNPRQQLKQENLHLQQHKPLPQTLPRVRIKRDIRPPDRLQPELGVHRHNSAPPPFRDELRHIGTPDLRVVVHAKGVPADECLLGDWDLAA